MLIGLRTGRQLALTKASGWGFRPDAAIFPTPILEELDRIRKENAAGDESLVACTPTQTFAILDHKAGRQEAEGFSIVTLEGTVGTVPAAATSSVAFNPIQGQKLAVLIVRSENHDPTTIVRIFQFLTVERVQRSEDRSPAIIHCSSQEKTRDMIGAPAFDADGHVIGCVKSAGQEIQVIPIIRLASLLQSNP